VKKSRVFRQLVTIECIAIVAPAATEEDVAGLDFEAYARDGVMQMASPRSIYVTTGEAKAGRMEELTP
jgi:hypothetical protein